MEILVRKFDLLKELSLIQGVIERKTTMPILANVLAEAASDGSLRLAATDLELALQTSCPANIRQSGSTAIPARKLLDYVKLLPDADIAVKRMENHWVQLRCGRSHTKMVGMSRENFPEMPVLPSGSVIKIPGAPLGNLIRKAIFAIANEESRYTLNGALLILKPSSLTIVATDGHRLAYAMHDELALAGAETEQRALVPKKALSELLNLLADSADDATVEFAQNETHLFFRLTASSGVSRVLSARKLNGQFPNFEAVLPKESPRSVTLRSDEFAAALRRVAQFADERSRAVRLKLDDGKLVLTSSSSETGESDEELDTEYRGEAMTIGFNAQYLTEFLEAAKSEEVLLEFRDEQSAGQLRPRGGDGVQYRYVVMPMRI